MTEENLLEVVKDAVLSEDKHSPELIAQIEHPSELQELLGKVMKSVTRNGDDSIDFEATTGERWQMSHEQDCCETVKIDDIIGWLDDLVGAPIAMAEVISNSDNPKDDESDSFTWTFYKFATVKGYVTVRWYGTSGNYSETATFRRIKDWVINDIKIGNVVTSGVMTFPVAADASLELGATVHIDDQGRAVGAAPPSSATEPVGIVVGRSVENGQAMVTVRIGPPIAPGGTTDFEI